MPGTEWTKSEKRVARRVFDAALERELAAVMAEFKLRAAAAKEADDIWATEEYLTRARKDINAKYEYSYSRMVMLLGWLLREERIAEHELDGLAEDKLVSIRYISSC